MNFTPIEQLAVLAGVSLRTVRNKIREYGLPAWRA